MRQLGQVLFVSQKAQKKSKNRILLKLQIITKYDKKVRQTKPVPFVSERENDE